MDSLWYVSILGEPLERTGTWRAPVLTETWRSAGTYWYLESLWDLPVLGEPLVHTSTWTASGTYRYLESLWYVPVLGEPLVHIPVLGDPLGCTGTWRSGTYRYLESLWYIPVLGEPLVHAGTWTSSGTHRYLESLWCVPAITRGILSVFSIQTGRNIVARLATVNNPSAYHFSQRPPRLYLVNIYLTFYQQPYVGNRLPCGATQRVKLVCLGMKQLAKMLATHPGSSQKKC